jgi:AcrR family transcriptional regulator
MEVSPPARRSTGQSTRLGRADWVAAALAALATGGLAAVAVEPLAGKLGASKGSFYWHFANRDDLIVATLEAWERDTERVIDMLEQHADPGTRLRVLIGHAFGDRSVGSVDAALLADAGSPLVAPVLERVSLRRLGYLERTYAAFGLSERVARERALLAYTAYLGLFSLRRAAPTAIPDAGLIAAFEPLLAPPPQRSRRQR